MKKIIVALIFLMTGILFFGCSSENNAAQSTDNQISVVQRGTISNQITATGNLKMPHYAKLSFGASGTVDEVNVILGQEVKQGQIMAKLDASTQSSLQQALLQAQVNQKQAQMQLENASTPTLSSSGSTVSAPDPLDIESKEIALEKAKLAVEDAQRQLDGAVLIAPFDGQVAEINITPEDKVSSSTVAIRIIDPNLLQVDTLVNETDIYNVSVGVAATIEVTALPSINLPATVIAISPSATVSGGVVSYTVQLQAKAPQSTKSNAEIPSVVSNNETSLQKPANFTSGSTGTRPSQNIEIPTLKEGLSVNVTIVISQKADVLLVPVRAISREGGNAFVTVLNDDETTEKRTVKTGINDWQNMEITEGLSEGEEIVITKSASSGSSTTTNSQPGASGMPPGMMMR